MNRYILFVKINPYHCLCKVHFAQTPRHFSNGVTSYLLHEDMVSHNLLMLKSYFCKFGVWIVDNLSNNLEDKQDSSELLSRVNVNVNISLLNSFQMML